MIRSHVSDLPDLAAGSELTLDAAESRHVLRVRRAQVGDELSLFDGQGAEAIATLSGVTGPRSRQLAVAEVTRRWQAPRPTPRVTVAAPTPKGGLADDMVAQLSQVGADAWQPLITQRSVVAPRDAKWQKFQRAALESAKQCGRSYLLQINEPRTLDDLLAHPRQSNAGDTDKRRPRLLMARQDGASAPFADASISSAHPDDLLIFIGPEGGFTAEELALADRAQALPWRLGPWTMRIETAAVMAAGIARYELDRQPNQAP